MLESHNECVCYAVVEVKDRVVVHVHVRLLSKAVSRIVAELYVLSKGIILELISSFRNACLINFCGFIKARKFFGDEKFPGYSTCFAIINLIDNPTMNGQLWSITGFVALTFRLPARSISKAREPLILYVYILCTSYANVINEKPVQILLQEFW